MLLILSDKDLVRRETSALEQARDISGEKYHVAHRENQSNQRYSAVRSKICFSPPQTRKKICFWKKPPVAADNCYFQ